MSEYVGRILKRIWVVSKDVPFWGSESTLLRAKMTWDLLTLSLHSDMERELTGKA